MDLRSRRGMIGSKITGSRLPAAYQEVEYLQSTSTQYLSVPVSFDGNGIEVCAKYKILEQKAYGPYIFGTINNVLMLVHRNANIERTRFKVNNINYNSSSAAPVNEDIVIFVENGKVNMSYSTQTFNIPSPKGSSNLIVFAYGQGPLDQAYRAPLKISYLKITNLDGSGIELIPCYRKSDNKPGMYDLISKTFLTNDGTGEFQKGPDVT